MLTIGNFDGVHRGHRALLQGLREEGRKRNLPVVVMIFEPQPLELFCDGQVTCAPYPPAGKTALSGRMRCGLRAVCAF
ncbi:Riboflavin kinase / FMN adenylyltransferase [Citrobacter freundii]|uniref:FAD synthase n=1 Tax=Citrobacter freundii TaxID=546 RepID=A0A7G2IH03_CITFR|nr:Riboflavin kinase / FMN adenylyltransferase [Citrobacter freundii]